MALYGTAGRTAGVQCPYKLHHQKRAELVQGLERSPLPKEKPCVAKRVGLHNFSKITVQTTAHYCDCNPKCLIDGCSLF